MKHRSACVSHAFALIVMSIAAATHHSAAAQTAPEPKVLIIGIDGLYWPAVERAATPVLDSLVTNGAISTSAHTGDVTVSGPGWSSVLCGVGRDKHGVDDNDFLRPAYDRYPSIFTLLRHARPEAVTAAFLSWEPLHKFTIFDDAVTHKVFNPYDTDGDVKNVEAAEAFLESADVDLVFFYFSDVDTAGHNHGFSPHAPEYVAEIEQVDGQLGRLIGALRRRPLSRAEDWLILVTTDHGGTLDRNHGRDEPRHREIVYIASGRAAARGPILHTVNQVDVVPTALTHLGVEINPNWNLDGRVSGLPVAAKLNENLLLNGDAEWSAGHDTSQSNAGVPCWTDLGPMTVVRAGSAEGYPSPDSPGSSVRGRQFFAGGAGGDAVISQRIDVGALAGLIDRGTVRCELGALLGGFADQRDLAFVVARFLSADGVEQGRLMLEPVTLADRAAAFGGTSPAAWTGFIRRDAAALVPIRTRVIEVALNAEVADGANDGYADDISLVLRAGR